MATVRRGPIAILGVILAATLAALLVISSAGAQAATNGRVRVMHASPDAPAVDIFVDGQKAVTALAFPNNTGYVSLPAGTRNVKVFVSPSNGTGAAALEADLAVAAGVDYTVLAVGRLADSTLALLPLRDNNALPAQGKAHVRLIHASPDAPAVNVAVAGTSTNVFSNVAFKGVGDYTPVATGTYNLDVKVASSGQTAKSVTGLVLGNQGVYTAVAVGLAGAGTLQVVPLVDVAPAPRVPSTGSGAAIGETGSGWSTLALALLGVSAVAAAGAVAVRARR
ncbi:MAG: DUF4397 domain-containing protein [Dehalococcoidia bacterium]